jgi:hypothetical protein
VRSEAIHAREHQALNGRRDVGGFALLHVAQQLLEKQRIAFGALDTARGEAVGSFDESAGELAGFLSAQRSQIDRHQRAAVRRCAPYLVQRIAFDARCHHEDHGALRCADRQPREVPQQSGRCPVNVLDDDQPRLFECGALHDRGNRLGGALCAGGVVHRVEHGLHLGPLRQIEQVVDMHLVLGLDPAFAQATFDRRPARRFVGLGVDLQQILQDHGNRVLAPADPEVQHMSGVTRAATRGRAGAQLVDQPRLADPRFATHADGHAGTAFDRRLERAGELTQLAVTADERTALGAARLHGSYSPDAYRLVESFDLDCTERVGFDQMRDRRVQCIGDDGLAGLGFGIQPRGKIHGVSRDGVLRLRAASHHGRDHLSARDSDMQLQRLARSVDELRRGAMQLDRSAHRALTVVAEGDRRPEHGHHAISGMIDDVTAIGLDRRIGDA